SPRPFPTVNCACIRGGIRSVVMRTSKKSLPRSRQKKNRRRENNKRHRLARRLPAPQAGYVCHATLRAMVVDLIFRGRARRERVRRSPCQRQLLLQKPRRLRRRKRIFYRFKELTTSSFMSVTPNRLRTF